MTLRIIGGTVLRRIANSLGNVCDRDTNVDPFTQRTVKYGRVVITLCISSTGIITIIRRLILGDSHGPRSILVRHVVVAIRRRGAVVMTLRVITLGRAVVADIGCRVFASIKVGLVVSRQGFIRFLRLTDGPHELDARLTILRGGVFATGRLSAVERFTCPTVSCLRVFYLFCLGANVRVCASGVEGRSVVNHTNGICTSILNFHTT